MSWRRRGREAECRQAGKTFATLNRLSSNGIEAGFLDGVRPFASNARSSCVLSIIGSLIVAAVLPRGHSMADRLRAFAGQVPSLAVRGAEWLWKSVVVGGLALLVILVLVNL